MTKQISNRANYVQGNISHEDYYGQFITPAVNRIVIKAIGLEKLRATKGDLSLIPLGAWDRIGLAMSAVDLLEQAGDSYSLSAAVCINKTAARLILSGESE